MALLKNSLFRLYALLEIWSVGPHEPLWDFAESGVNLDNQGFHGDLHRLGTAGRKTTAHLECHSDNSVAQWIWGIKRSESLGRRGCLLSTV